MRILVADDDPGVMAAYRTAFESQRPSGGTALSAMAADLFGDAGEPAPGGGDAADFDVSYVDQGEEAVAAVTRAVAAGAPFQVVFLDMRMPPGIDGRETARRVRLADPEIHIVMVTGYSDSSPQDVARVAGPPEKFFYVAKPFEVAEIVQLSRALSEKWHVERQLRAAHAALRDQVALLEQRNLELAASEGRTRYAAFHDSLTGAPNRSAFLQELAARTGADNGRFAVAIVDIDRFKQVNDTLGHAAGDELVRVIWASIQAVLPPGSAAARIGGDEFGIVMPLADEGEAKRTCEQLVEVCGRDRVILGHTVRIGASIGLAFSLPAGERDGGDLVRRADLALYAAKRAGKGQVSLYDESLDENVRLRHQVEDGLRAALGNGELALVFQPIVRQDTKGIEGFEALLRWNSALLGAVPPSLFIPIAEDSNLIHQLSDWVVAHALEVCAGWPTQYVSINFSPRQFRRPGLVSQLSDAVAAAGLTPDRVQIEITETSLFDDPAGAAGLLAKLRALGFRVALDDFGTGYSSLFNLKNFDIDSVKIDRSFVMSLGGQDNSMAIVSSIAQLARTMGLSTVAEGVEDELQHHALRLAGCSHMQGYLFGYPAAAGDIAAADLAGPLPAAETVRRATA